VFREFLTYNSNKRSHYNPNLPTLEEISCQDFPVNAMILVGPKGLPKPIAKKLVETFKKVADSAAFQGRLASLDLPYDWAMLNWIMKFPSYMRREKTSCLKWGARKRDSRNREPFIPEDGESPRRLGRYRQGEGIGHFRIYLTTSPVFPEVTSRNFSLSSRMASRCVDPRLGSGAELQV